jgi:hypothetical protein
MLWKGFRLLPSPKRKGKSARDKEVAFRRRGRFGCPEGSGAADVRSLSRGASVEKVQTPARNPV